MATTERAPRSSGGGAQKQMLRLLVVRSRLRQQRLLLLLLLLFHDVVHPVATGHAPAATAGDTTRPPPHIAVIGAGFSGLTAACELRTLGYEVRALTVAEM